MIGHDANGEETPMHTVWSLSTMTDAELKESRATGDAEAPADK